MFSHKLLSRGLAAVCAGVLALALAPAPPAHAASTITLVSAHTIVPVGSHLTATVRVTPAVAGIYVYSVVHDPPWHTVGAAATDAAGRATVSLDWDIHTVGTLGWHIYAEVGEEVPQTGTFSVTRTPNVRLLSAPRTAAPGQPVTARVGVTGAIAGSTGFTDALVGGSWSRSQQAPMTSLTEFTLPLTYGASTPGIYTFRAGATVNGITGYSGRFDLVRASLNLQAAPSNLPVGVTGSARGKVVAPPMSPTTGALEVWHGGWWVPIQWAPINSAGEFTVPLAYGVHTAGTYTFRLWYSLGEYDLYTRSWTVTRS